jgi:hypothetical protein
MIELKKDQMRFCISASAPRCALMHRAAAHAANPRRRQGLSAAPPGLGRFPIRHVDDHAASVPELWLRHGGVMTPMYQSEAL